MNQSNHNFLPLRPQTPISLWDMIEILPSNFTKVWRELDTAISFSTPQPTTSGEQPRPEIATLAQQEFLIGLVTELWNTCKKWDLKQSLFVVDEARLWLVEPHRHATWQTTDSGRLT
jgi:hypothetical protein